MIHYFLIILCNEFMAYIGTIIDSVKLNFGLLAGTRPALGSAGADFHGQPARVAQIGRAHRLVEIGDDILALGRAFEQDLRYFLARSFDRKVKIPNGITVNQVAQTSPYKVEMQASLMGGSLHLFHHPVLVGVEAALQ